MIQATCPLRWKIDLHAALVPPAPGIPSIASPIPAIGFIGAFGISAVLRLNLPRFPVLWVAFIFAMFPPFLPFGFGLIPLAVAFVFTRLRWVLPLGMIASPRPHRKSLAPFRQNADRSEPLRGIGVFVRQEGLSAANKVRTACRQWIEKCVMSSPAIERGGS